MKKIIKVLAVILIPIVCLWLLQCLLVPKYMDSINEGAMVAEYYKSEKNNDVIILGDCETYENISPVTMWNEYGISSYIRGSAEQLIWQSYYMLEDTLRYETPKAVVLNVLAMQQAEAKSEPYNRMTLDGMKWSSAKINSIKVSMTENETMADYVFPLLRYHSRWTDLSKEDLTYMFKRDIVTSNGYLCQVGVRPVTTLPQKKPLANYQFSDKNYEYLQKIVDLCNNKGIKLILVKAPSVYPYWYEEWDEQIKNFAAKNNVTYVNMIEKADEIGLDYSMDTFDYGQHLNVNGAEKYSKYLGRIIVENANLLGHKGEKEYIDYWNEKTKEYNQIKEEKYKEWSNDQ